MLFLVLLMVVENLARPQSLPTFNEDKLDENQKGFILAPQFQRQQYFHYDFPLLEPQFYGYPGNKPPIVAARVQPQIVLYHQGNGAVPAPGQSFLLQPGPLQSPGNFLIPSSPQPSPPILIAGYPKPAHIPPVEKDAEEIPTNPAKIPPLPTTQGRRTKPEKLESLDGDKRIDSEVDALAEADRSPSTTSLHPGQRFFILNGEHLYPSLQNYPYPQKFSQLPNEENVVQARESPANFLLLNQNSGIFAQQQFLDTNPADFSNLYRLINSNSDNIANSEAVVIGSGDHDDDDDDDNDNSELDSQDDITAVNSKADDQPTVSQAQPGAIALAGPGGVASAAPRGTALAGKEGVAVSSPQATAVAGPQPKQPHKENSSKKKDKRD